MERFNSPHGGKLINRILTGKQRKESLKKAPAYPRIMLDDVETNDLELIATGAYSPLTGFMNQEDYVGVLKRNCLENGLVWTVPITLNIPQKIADKIKNNNWVALIDKVGKVIATMYVTDKYKLDRELEVQLLYQSMRAKQIELEQLYQNREIALAGEIFLLDRPSYAVQSKYRQDPAAMRNQLGKLGWRRVVAFQAPNPISHSTDSIEKCALEIVDGLLWQPQIAEVKMGEKLLHQKMKNHHEMIEHYYPAENVYLSYLPWVSRQAGPREVVLEAIVRKNYGCTHYIVAEKQYRMYNFYNLMDFRRIFEEISIDDLGIIPIFAEETFYCRKCGKVVTSQICPHDRLLNEMFNPLQYNEMLSKGEIPPLEFSGEGVFPFLANKLWNDNVSDDSLQTDGISELNPKLRRLIDNC